jgi:hypothetical protein
MNLQTISALAAVGLSSAQEPWLGTLPILINEALNQIQQRRSWNCMKVPLQFILPVTGPGPYAYALPATFKELQSGANSLSASSTAFFGNSIWRIFTRQEVNRLQQIGTNVSERTAFLEQSPAGIWSVNFPGPLTMGTLPPDTNFNLDTYSFLPPVVLPTDENDLMAKYPMLVLEFTKFLMYSLGADEDSIAAKNEATAMINGKPGGFAGYFAQASADDASRATRGRTMRFGGF